jgi:hypothetical protein
MGISTLISTATASGASSVDITSGIDSTYDEYMFVITDWNPSSDSMILDFNGSIDGGSNYNVTKTTAMFRAYHTEADASALQYESSYDLAQGTGGANLTINTGSGADESAAGILHLFSPASTTYVTHFYWRGSNMQSSSSANDIFVGGYFNSADNIDAVTFKPQSGNMDCVIQMYGIA